MGRQTGVLDSNTNGQRTAPSVERALDIIEFVRDRGELTFAEIVLALGLPKSTTFILLRTLTARGYLRLSPQSRRYAVGLRLWEAGAAFRMFDELVAHSLPAMQRITAALNETTQLAVLEGDQNLYLAKVDCEHPLRLVSAVGRRLPARATGVGKALLSGLSDAALDLLYAESRAFQQFTPATIATVADLKAELAEVRRAGYALDREEYTPGVRCVAVPIFGTGKPAVAAAISVATPAVRWSEQTFLQARALLWTGAAEISAKLGMISYPIQP